MPRETKRIDQFLLRSMAVAERFGCQNPGPTGWS